MPFLYVSNPKNLKKENINLDKYDLILMVDKNSKEAKKLAKEGKKITVFKKDGELIYSNIIPMKKYDKNIGELLYIFYKKYLSAINFIRKKEKMENPSISKKSIDRQYYNTLIKPVSEMVISNKDYDHALSSFNTVDDFLYQEAYKYIESQDKSIKENEKYFKQMFGIYRNLLYSILAFYYKKERIDTDILSIFDSYILWLMSDIFINYKIEKKDIANGKFTEEFLRVMFRLFNEKINHGSLKNIKHYMNISLEELQTINKNPNAIGNYV